MEPTTFLRGLQYLGLYVATVGSPILLVGALPLSLRGERRPLAISAGLMAVAIPAYAVVISGDGLIGLPHNDIEVTDPVAVRSVLRGIQPSIVINTAAFHRVDDCETQVDDAWRVNALGVKYLAEACREHEAVLVHFSTAAERVISSATSADVGEDADVSFAGDDGGGEASTRLVARVSPKTRIAEGQEIELAVDTARLYFFDPETGESV
jgi:hypothetical protein